MSTDLVKITRELISTNERFDQIVQQLRQETICLIPQTLNLGARPELKMSLHLIHIDPKSARDVYEIDGTLALHLGKLKEIADRAKIRVTSSRTVEVQHDEKGTRVILVKHEIAWERLDLDGSMRKGVVTGTYDYLADKIHRSNQAEKRNKHAYAHAESNAYTRMVSDALAGLPRGMNANDLRKPICVYSVVEDKGEMLKFLSPEDRYEILKAQAAKALGVADQIYGGPKHQALPQGGDGTPPPAPEAPPAKPNGKDAADASFTEIPNNKTPTRAEQNHITALEYREADQSVRTQKILDLCKLTGFKIDGKEIKQSHIEKSSIDRQIARIEELLNLKDSLEENDGVEL